MAQRLILLELKSNTLPGAPGGGCSSTGVDMLVVCVYTTVYT